MKILIVAIFIAFGLNACAAKSEKNHFGSYEQTNAASEKAFKELDSK